MSSTLPSLPPRPEEGHKGTFGSVLILAGRRGMSGAAVLAGLGALRSGAGLVTVGVPIGIQASVAGYEPSFLTLGLPEDEEGGLSPTAREVLWKRLPSFDVIACGPGWGQSPNLRDLVTDLYREVRQPLVLDADALNLLASGAPWPVAPPDAPRIVTPHPGEFSRLTGKSIAEILQNREQLAAEWADAHGVTLILKGHPSLITDGRRGAWNNTGNNGMGTGGCGDVLTGIVTALLGQGMTPFEACQLGAHLHGLAGDIAIRTLSQPGLIASDLPRFLGTAWLALGSR